LSKFAVEILTRLLLPFIMFYQSSWPSAQGLTHKESDLQYC